MVYALVLVAVLAGQPQPHLEAAGPYPSKQACEDDKKDILSSMKLPEDVVQAYGLECIEVKLNVQS